MIRLLKKGRWNFALVLCAYLTLAVVQPLLHTHLDNLSDLLHLHKFEDFHQGQQNQNYEPSENHNDWKVLSGDVSTFPAESTAVHLLLNNSGFNAYPSIQPVTTIIQICLPDLLPGFFAATIPTRINPVVNTTEYPPLFNSLIITSLTDLSPPIA